MNPTPASTRAPLTVTLPGVVSWSRPRRHRGRLRYPAAYARDRDAWATVVAHAVTGRDWRPPQAARYRVTVVVSGGGKRDLDRVCTAVLDALQAGGVFRDDCLVDALQASRAPVAGSGEHTDVEVIALPARRRARAAAPSRRGRRSR